MGFLVATSSRFFADTSFRFRVRSWFIPLVRLAGSFHSIILDNTYSRFVFFQNSDDIATRKAIQWTADCSNVKTLFLGRESILSLIIILLKNKYHVWKFLDNYQVPCYINEFNIR
uniref:Uncharacterized protein n=1 Tax=Cacopsylla melanoneura TaxID=428564 RepID=A0A8D8ZCL5_9HEMI